MTNKMRRKLLIQGAIAACHEDMTRDGADLTVISDVLDQLGHEAVNQLEFERIAKQMGYSASEEEPYYSLIEFTLMNELCDAIGMLEELRDGKRDHYGRMLMGIIKTLKKAESVLFAREKDLSKMADFKIDSDTWDALAVLANHLPDFCHDATEAAGRKVRRGFVKLAFLVGQNPFNLDPNGLLVDEETEVKLK